MKLNRLEKAAIKHEDMWNCPEEDYIITPYQSFLEGAEFQRKVDIQLVMDLLLALRNIKGKVTNKDLIKLAKRMKK
jgi:hypothetical protein